MASLKNSKPKKGASLHHYVATGGNPKNFNKINNTEKLRASSKKTK